MAATARKQAIDDIAKLVAPATGGAGLVGDEQSAFNALSRELADAKSRRFAQPLERLRQVLLVSQAGLAVCVGDGNALILLADNLIGGRVSIYGEATAAKLALEGATLKPLDLLIRKRGSLQPGTGDLRLRNNRLHEVRTGDDMIAAVLTAVKNGKGPVDGVLASIIADANVLTGPASEMVAVVTAFVHNVVKPSQVAVGTVASFRAKYLGNIGDGDTALTNAGSTSEQEHNAELTISDVS